ncbi:MAG: ferredoxin [Novosphingobium sp.]
MKITVNRALCDGDCAAAAPELFMLDDNDQLVILIENPGEELRAKAEAAVRACRKDALRLGE